LIPEYARKYARKYDHMAIWQYAEFTNTPCSYAEYADKYAKYVKQYAKHDSKKICNLHIFFAIRLVQIWMY
jgi:hypothetical protein